MSARATPTRRTQPSPAPAPALAAPAWRQFSFFHAAPVPSPATTPTRSLTAHPALVSAVHSNVHLSDSLVLVADLDGNLHAVDDHWEPLHTWTAYDGGRVTHILSSEWDLRAGRAIVVTVGDDASSPFPLLKVWLLSLPSPATAPTSPDSPALPHLTLLRRAPISPVPARPSPVSALALAPSLSHVVLGLADGAVVAFKRLDDLVEASLVDLDDAAARAAAPLEPSAASRAARSAGNGAGARGALVPGGMGKLRVLWDGNREPVTNLGITAAPPPPSSPAAGTQTLFVLTTSQILALPLPSSSSSSRAKQASKAQQPTVLDDHGAAVGCARVMRLGGGKGLGGAGAGAGEGEQTAERMVVARDEAIYVYGPEGREGCWAYEGSKSSIVPLHSSTVTSPSSPAAQRLPTPYLAIVSPPQPSSLASTSATIRQHARATANGASASTATAGEASGGGGVAKVTVFDPENKFVAYSGTFGADEGGAVREVVEAWGAVWVLTEGGKLFRLTEQPIQQSFETLFQRNLFTLGISLAHSRGLGEGEVADIYRRYGDHLYGKSDYEGAMAAYLKTVGTVQASYVIRKFLDAQRLTHLTSYLQELHSRGLANSDITTLLLNCYTKLKDDDALSRFIHSSSSSSSAPSTTPSPGESAPAEPPFDLETAIRVLRQAGYFTHATWLAQRYRAHADFLRIAIEDAGDYAGALRYVRELARGGGAGEGEGEGGDEARESMQRWGGVLLAHEPDLTTDVLVEICCGGPAAVGGKEEDASAREGKDKDRVASLRAASGARDASSSFSSPSTNAYDVPDSASLSGSTAAGGEPLTAEPDAFSTPNTTTPDLPSPRQFFAHFVDRPRHFISFLERVAARRYGRPVDSLVPPATLVGAEAPLPSPRDAVEEKGGARRLLDARARDEQVVWNTLLELYVSPLPPRANDDEREREQLQAKALRVLRCRDQAPYDEMQALLVCTTQGFEEGFVLLYELLGMYEEILRYWIDAAKASPSAPDRTSRIVRALHRYGPSCPSLYRLVLSHLTSSSDLLSRHQADVLDILDEVDREKVLPPIAVVQILSAGGVASVGLVREYLKRQLLAEKQEIDSDQALITSYRAETAKKRREIHELSDPEQPRIFQVTRCSACGGQLDLPGVHFMCRHSYHQRCLGENESQCPNCARTHGVVREIRKNNAQLAGRHDLFLQEVHESDDPFAAVANAFARGFMGSAGGAAAAQA